MALVRRDKIILLLSIVFLFIVALKKGYQHRHYSLVIEGHEPKEVWDLLSDFRNIHRLNPRIKFYEIGNEHTGPDGSWHYEVESHEVMRGVMVFGPNINKGHITVKSEGGYSITSEFITSSFRGLITVENTSVMKMAAHTAEDSTRGTLYTEEVFMDCPLFFNQLCIKETDDNRKDFMKNLQYYFSN